MAFPSIEMHEEREGGTGGGQKTRNSVRDMLRLRCLSDIQAKMLNRHLDT